MANLKLTSGLNVSNLVASNGEHTVLTALLVIITILIAHLLRMTSCHHVLGLSRQVVQQFGHLLMEIKSY